MGNTGPEPMEGVDTCVMMHKINCDPLVPENGIPVPGFPMSCPAPFTDDERAESFSQCKVKAQPSRSCCCFSRETGVSPARRQRFGPKSLSRLSQILDPTPRDHFRPDPLGSLGLRRWDMEYQERRLTDISDGSPKILHLEGWVEGLRNLM